jgi:hypothetical protein
MNKGIGCVDCLFKRKVKIKYKIERHLVQWHTRSEFEWTSLAFSWLDRGETNVEEERDRQFSERLYKYYRCYVK